MVKTSGNSAAVRIVLSATLFNHMLFDWLWLKSPLTDQWHMVAMKRWQPNLQSSDCAWQIITDFHAHAWYLGAGFRSACVLPSLSKCKWSMNIYYMMCKNSPEITSLQTFSNQAPAAFVAVTYRTSEGLKRTCCLEVGLGKPWLSLMCSHFRCLERKQRENRVDQ